MLPVEKKADWRRKRKKREVRREEGVRLRWWWGWVGVLDRMCGVGDAGCCFFELFEDDDDDDVELGLDSACCCWEMLLTISTNCT